ncbi:MAG TPA: hypothetical protein VHM00_03445 [Caldimonas sp.]|jgi:hypothetical protein|nr:hypothetical protein [Caldimonas sp.]HEX2540118.1 hypothetical protein [Caldimonas sp.]
MTAPDLARLRPVPVDDLVRLGRDHDGGYVVSERCFRDCGVLIGLGINTDWSFEEAVLARRPGMALIGVDGTVSAGRLRRDAWWHGLRAAAVAARGRLNEARAEWAASRDYRQLRVAFRGPTAWRSSSTTAT